MHIYKYMHMCNNNKEKEAIWVEEDIEGPSEGLDMMGKDVILFQIKMYLKNKNRF